MGHQSTTAHSDLAETVKHIKREMDTAMDYFSIVMDQYRPQQGVLTTAQAAAAGVESPGELQVRNAEVYMEVDAPNVKYKQFLAKVPGQVSSLHKQM